MMLYPENESDPRAKASGVKWRYTREQVSQMTSFQARAAGTLGEENMRLMDIDWVTFEGKRIPYRSMKPGGALPAHTRGNGRPSWTRIRACERFFFQQVI